MLLLAVGFLSSLQVNAQLCTPGTSGGCSSGDQYSSFSTGGGVSNINHNPGATCLGDATGYAAFSGAGLSASAAPGASLTTSVTTYAGGVGPGQGFAIWIDWNQDAVFQATEQVYASAGVVGLGITDVGGFTVPAGAMAGPTTLRIRSLFDAPGTSIDPCAFYSGNFGMSFDFPFTVLTTSFVNGTPQSLTVCKNAAATSINSLLTIEDPTPGLTETWTVTSAPTHGTLGGFPFATLSTGSNVTPTGLTYTPAGGYSGPDAFTIQVSNGTQTSSTTINVNVSSPNVTTFTMSGSTVCPGTGSIITVNPTSLANGTYTVNYTLSGATSLVSSASLVISGGSGTFTTAPLNSGFTSITVTSVTNSDGCTTLGGGTTGVSTLPVPTAYNVGGGGNYCSGGTGPNITLAATGICCPPVGVNYQLYISGSTPVGSPQPGAFAAISFGPQNAAGVYTVIATNTSTGCTALMTGSATVGINPLPNQYSVTVASGGHYCTGGSGLVISLPGSTSGDNYQLVLSGTPVVGTIVGGTGGAISFPAQTAAGTYTVRATTTATGCIRDMLNTVDIIVDPLPTAFNVTQTNGGHYCSGGTGVTIGLDGSQGASFSYQLKYAGSAVGSPVLGTGGIITFPPQTIAGTYTITATNVSSTCTVNMTGSATVVIDPTPAAVTNGGSTICQGSTVTLSDGSGTGTWISSNPGVATVGLGSGIVTGVSGPGTSTITFTLTTTGCTQTTFVSVNPTPSPIGGAGSVCVGSSITLTSTPGGGAWTSSPGGLATITAGGVLTGASQGLVTVTYTLPGTGCFITAPVTVNPLPANITGPNTVCVGSTILLSDATSGGTWSSTNVSQATVTAGGNVTGAGSGGNPSIVYTISTGCFTSYALTVNPAPLPISGTLSVCQGSTTNLTDASGPGTWVSSNGSVATVGSSSGIVSGVSGFGTTIITFTLPTTCTVNATVTVNPLPAGISGITSVCVGSTIGLSDATTGGTWASSDVTKATVGSNSGIVTGVAPGTSTITYALGTGCTATGVVTVNPSPAGITGSSTVCVNATTALGDATSGGAWVSSSPANATVSGTGVVTGVLAGNTIISYTVGGCTTTFPMTINPLPSAISGNAPVCVNGTIGLSDAGGGTWTSSNNTIATVGSASGIVTGVAPGTSTITYTLATSCSITTIVTVNPLPAPITGTFTVCVGLTTTLVDGTTGGTWASSNVALATVGSSTGVVTGVSNGVPIITYTLPTGCIAVQNVTVNPLPAAITGANTVCTGYTIGLSDAGGGTWTSSNGAVATAGLTTGVVGGVTAGTSTIVYTLPTGCTASSVITVNQTPLAISGTNTICVGTTTLLASGTPGGTWISSNPAQATVVNSGAGAGTVTGVAGGAPTISYIMPTGCYAVYIVTVNPLPGAIVGATSVCTGATIGLSDAGGGTWASSDGSKATVTLTTGIVTGVGAGTVTITYTLPTGCFTTSTITVNPTPVAITMIPVCVGSTVTLADGTTGGTWASSNVAEATINSGSGVTGGVAAGNPTITYTLPTGCFITGIETVNPLPSAISGPSNVCVGSTIALTDAGGGTWASSNLGVATVVNATGVVTGVGPGTTTITYTLPTGCSITTTITVNPQPSAIGGIASVCVGQTSTLTDATTGGTWASSNTTLATVTVGGGVVSGVAAGNPVITYTLPTGCFITVIETVNPLPSAISGIAAVCAGSTITLTDAGGGTWASSNVAVATVVTGTGVVTGVTPGTSTITYTLPTGCTATGVVTVNTQPAAIGGTPFVCTGLTTTLNDATSGGVWSSSNNAQATVGAGTGVVTGVTAGTPNITYTIGACFSIVQVTVSTSPAAISGTRTVCVGATTNLTDLTSGGTWSSSNNAVFTVNSTTGTVTGVSGPATATIIYTLPSSCTISAIVTVNPMPGPIVGTLVVCAGSTTTLTDTVLGGTWISGTPAVATIGLNTGIAGGVAGGTTNITYSLGAGCISVSVLTVNPLPNITNFTSPTATNVCVGGGSTVTVNSTTLGTGTYTLSYTLTGANTGTATATLTQGPANGTFFIPGASLSNTGVTTITINSITNSFGCTSNTLVNNTTTTNTFPLPFVYNVTVSGTGGYCAGGTGVHIFLSGSASGINYQLYNGATPVGGPVAGTTAGLDFGLQTAPGTYTVIATNTTTGCQNTMSGAPVVFINPTPAVNNVTGGGGYCFGGTGVHVGLNGSNATYTYQLYNGASTVGGPIAGTGSPLDFGLETAAGTYTVVATIPATGCTSNMSGSATVVINPLPSAISGTTSVCPGTTSTLGSAPSGGTWSSSFPGIATVGSTTGTVTGVSAGTTTITYTSALGCSVTTPVVVNPLPSAITGASSVCTGSTTVLADGGSGTWSSSNTLVASINLTSGLVSGVAPGNVIITYTLGTGCTATLPFTVNPTPVAIGGTLVVCAGSTTALTDANTGGTWSSSAAGVATVVTGTGVVTGVSAGTATITYTLPAGCTVTAIVTVNPSPAVITGPTNICTGLTSPLADATSGGTWSSSNNAEATVGLTTGIVTGVAAGNPTITYTLPAGCTALYPVTVNSSPAPITGLASVCTTSTTTLADVTTGGVWSSSSTTLATVDPATGIVTGVATGFPNISYTLSSTGCAAIVQLTVNPTPPAISPATPSVCVGSSVSLTDATSGGTWASSSTALATVNASGSVTGAGAGNVTITYTLPAGCFTTRLVTVNVTPGAITGPTTVCSGQTIALSNPNGGGTWSSSNTAVASVVSGSGVVTGGTTAGTATITYLLNPGGCTTTYVITTNLTPAGILGANSVCIGSTTTLTDATSGGVWSSSNTALATVGAGTGTVGGIVAGVPNISYTLPTGCSAVKAITVNPLPAAITGSSTVCTGTTTLLSDATTGGTWSSSNTSVASVDPSTGTVSGVSVGTATINYVVTATGCSTSTVITVNQSPSAIVGSSTVCVGLTNALTDGFGGGTWTSSNTTLATIGATSGFVTGLAAGAPTITYTLPGGCFALLPITVNPTPAGITGVTSVCTGATTTLSDVSVGGTWSSSNTSMATVGSLSGIVSGVAVGVPTITYTLPGGCTATILVTVNQTPLPITGTTNVCASGSTTTLADASTGGTWSSSNTSLATVGSTGTVTGITAGVLNIIYTLPGGCSAATAFTVNPLPSSITGTLTACIGLSSTLTSSPGGGTWTSSNTSIAGVVSGTGVVTGVAAGTATISYTLPTGCKVGALFTVNPLPTAFTTFGGGAYCVGGTGLNVSLSGSTVGTSYQLMLGTTAVGSPLAGTGSALSFGLQTAAGTYTVIATNTATGCVNTMTSAAIVVINPLPALYNITGGGNYCIGGTGVLVGLNSSDTGVKYRLFNGATAVGPLVPGTGGAISFGLITPTGTYTVLATNNITGCTQTMLGTAVITTVPLPTVFTVSGGGTYCATGGTGVHIFLSGSQVGINYQLMNGLAPVGATIPGTGSGLDFGLITTVGTSYTVIATTATGGCSSTMSGTVSVGTTPNPPAFAVTNTGTAAYCFGGAGVNINLAGSTTGGISYQLYNGTTPIGSPVTGTGASISFGPQTIGGTPYTVIATNTITGCTSNMTGSVTLTVNPLPTVFSVSGGGGVCPGGTASIFLSGSTVGTTYTILLGGVVNVSGIAGTGAVPTTLSSNRSAAGVYTVIASIASTTCTVSMSGSTTIIANPAPTAYGVTGGGSYCAGGTGVAVGLGTSDIGVNYQLFRTGGIAVGSPIPGTSGAINFGLQTTASTYTVQATNAATGCTATMSGSAVVGINALPNSSYIVGGGGTVCVGGTGLPITLSNSELGVSYQLFNTGVATGLALIGTGSGLNFGLQTSVGIYTVVATNTTTGCSSTMVTSTSITSTTPPLAFAVTGGGSYCSGGTGVAIGLAGSATGINYQLMRGTSTVGGPVAGTGAAISFGLQTTAGTYTVIATNTTTGCTTTMTGTATISINPLPLAFTVTGGGAYCAGGGGVVVGLSGSQIGISYQLMNGTALAGAPVIGTGGAISFGLHVSNGVRTVVATNPATGCTSTMSGSVLITINPLPAVWALTGGGSYCPGGSGVAIGLTGSDPGVNYQLFLGSTAVGVPVAGTGATISFGLQTGVGTYTAVATNATTTCTSNMAGTATVGISALPTSFAITGGGSYCSGGSGVAIGLSGSVIGTNYQLYLGAVPVGLPLAGTGAALNFGLKTAAGTYTVIATSTATTCSATMSGSAVISVNPLPTVYAMTGGGSYCSGGTGVAVGLATSDTGIMYQLMRGTTAVGSPVAGTGAAISFGAQTVAGTYTVVATNSASTCVNTMAGTATITINALPAAYAVGGTGSYCSGGTGVHITLGGSDLGISYQLMQGSTPMGVSLAGTSLPLDFGLQTTAGAYTVVATNTSTGCTATMTGSATVTISPLPTVHNVTGGGVYCSGGTGVNVGLDGSDTGMHYQLFRGTTAVSTSISGTGGIISFGSQTVAGTYTVVATNTATGCTNTMTGSASVSINPLPTAYTMTGGGAYCSGGTGVNVGLINSDLHRHYQLMRGTVAVGASLPGVSGPLDFGLQTVAGTYTVVATNDTTGCSSTMTGSAIVTISPLPTAYTVMSVGTSYCAGTLGVDISLGNSDAGTNYQLYNAGVPVGIPVAGTGTVIDFGMQPAGTYTVGATNASTGCTSTMTGSITVVMNPLPSLATVTGGGAYCAGSAGAHIYVDASEPGVNYQLYHAGSPFGTVEPGTGDAIDFGAIALSGTYTVRATNSTTGCTSVMISSATVTVSPLPAAYPMAGGGSYCAGTGGTHVGLGGSDVGINYQLFRGATSVGSAVGGTGAGIDFGAQTAAGTYTVVATNTATGCTNTMTGVSTVSITALPVAYTMTGGGNYCTGGTGLHIGVSGSDTGVHYQLMLGSSAVGSSVSGTGSAIDFGLQLLAGTYTVQATSMSTGCSNVMGGTTVITISSLPAIYTVTGGGSYCASSSTGVHVGLSHSDLGINYQLYNGSVPVGGVVAGTGATAPLDFGLQPAGVYTVVAINGSTTCVSNMTGSATVTLMPTVTPSVTISTGVGDTVCAGSLITFTPVPVNGGTAPTYQWFVNGTPFATSTTYSYVPTDGNIVTVSMTSNAACPSPATASSTVTMTVRATVTPHVSITVSPNDTICAGTAVTFTAASTFGGSDPLYSWKQNGIPVSAGSTYTYIPTNGDVVFVTMNSNYICHTPGLAISNNIALTVESNASPIVDLTAAFGATINGTVYNDTFVAVVTNPGLAPTYQWSVNGIAVPGAIGPVFYSYSLVAGDLVTCTVTNHSICGTLSGSKSIAVTGFNVGVKPVVTAGSNIMLVPNPNQGDFTVKGQLGTIADNEVSLEVTDMLGQVVYKTTVMTHNGEINTRIQLDHNLANGMYILNLNSGVENHVFHVVVEQ